MWKFAKKDFYCFYDTFHFLAIRANFNFRKKHEIKKKNNIHFYFKRINRYITGKTWIIIVHFSKKIQYLKIEWYVPESDRFWPLPQILKKIHLLFSTEAAPSSERRLGEFIQTERHSCWLNYPPAISKKLQQALRKLYVPVETSRGSTRGLDTWHRPAVSSIRACKSCRCGEESFDRTNIKLVSICNRRDEMMLSAACNGSSFQPDK